MISVLIVGFDDSHDISILIKLNYGHGNHLTLCLLDSMLKVIQHEFQSKMLMSSSNEFVII